VCSSDLSAIAGAVCEAIISHREDKAYNTIYAAAFGVLEDRRVNKDLSWLAFIEKYRQMERELQTPGITPEQCEWI
jgi:hypothetical protein